MYMPISPAKNMISVERNSQMISLPLVSGKPGWYSSLIGGRGRASCVVLRHVVLHATPS